MWAVGVKPVRAVGIPAWTVEYRTFVVKGRTNSIDGSMPNPRTGSSDSKIQTLKCDSSNSKMWHKSRCLCPHDRLPLATSLTYLTNNWQTSFSYLSVLLPFSEKFDFSICKSLWTLPVCWESGFKKWKSMGSCWKADNMPSISSPACILLTRGLPLSLGNRTSCKCECMNYPWGRSLFQ